MHNEHGFHLIINKKENTKTYSLLINLFNSKNIVKLNSCSNFHFTIFCTSIWQFSTISFRFDNVRLKL